MKTFFINTATLKLYINVTGTFDYDALMPYVKTAQDKYIKKYLGKDLFDSLLDYYNADEAEPDEALDALLPYVQNALAKFAFYAAVPLLSITITSTGFGIVSNGNIVPASDSKIVAFRAALEMEGWDLIETMLKFLEEHVGDYTSWVDSDGYTTCYDTFIINADQFDSIIKINQSRLEFQNLISDMKNVELMRIEPTISSGFATAIKDEIKSGDISERVTAVLPLIRRAIAFYTYADYRRSPLLVRDQHTNLADSYLEQVKLILDGSPDVYTEYAASSSYNAANVSDMRYDNKGDSSIFVFGA